MSNLENALAFQLSALALPQPEREYRFCDRKYRLDFAWPQYRIAVEVQGGVWSGGAHGRGSGITRDYEKLNQAQLLGWMVLQFAAGDISSGRAAQVVEEAIRKAEGGES